MKHILTLLAIITIEMNVSGYCPCSKCCESWSTVYPRRTASGHVIKKGDRFVAAPRSYKFGTIMTIPGYNNSKRVVVEDRCGAIKSNKLDLYFDTHQEALNWGRRKVNVTIY